MPAGYPIGLGVGWQPEVRLAVSKTRRLLSLASWLSMLMAGLMGAVVVILVGPELAMGAAIWSGQTTEPMRPQLPFPWVALGLCVLGGLLCLAWQQQSEAHSGQATAAMVLTQVFGGLFALTPLVQLWRLVGRT